MSEPLTGHLQALVDSAPVDLCTVDEAQLLAVGWLGPSRGSGMTFAGASSPHDFAGLPAAQQRLLDSGLAVMGSTDSPAAMSAAGALRDYLELVTLRLQTASWISWPHDGPATSARLVRRVTPVRGTGTAVLERMDVPEAADPNDPLTVEMSLTTLERAAAELAELAFRDSVTDAERSAARGVESVFVGPDRNDGAYPSRLIRLWGKPKAVLYWYHLSLFGRRSAKGLVGRTGHAGPVTQDQYRKHLVKRLQVPEPPIT